MRRRKLELKAKPYAAGDTMQAYCATCGKFVPATLRLDDYPIPQTDIVVPKIMLSFCDWCDTLVGIPHQSSTDIQHGFLAATRIVDDLIAWAKAEKKRSSKGFTLDYITFINEELLPKLRSIKKQK